MYFRATFLNRYFVFPWANLPPAEVSGQPRTHPGPGRARAPPANGPCSCGRFSAKYPRPASISGRCSAFSPGRKARRLLHKSFAETPDRTACRSEFFQKLPALLVGENMGVPDKPFLHPLAGPDQKALVAAVRQFFRLPGNRTPDLFRNPGHFLKSQRLPVDIITAK